MKTEVNRIFQLFLILLLAVAIVLSLCGCESKSELPVYQQASISTPPDDTQQPTSAPSPSAAAVKEYEYIQDETLLAESEDMWLHSVSSYGSQFGQYLGTRVLSQDETQAMTSVLNELIANFYNWNYTYRNEDFLNAGYKMLNEALRSTLIESGHFEQFISDANAYMLDTKIRYASILENNVAKDYQSEKYGLVSCLRAEIILHTVADENNAFYDLYNYYVRGDSLLELLVFVQNVGDQWVVLAWEEFFCNPDHLNVYYPDYVGAFAVQPEQINELSLASLYESTGETDSIPPEELENVKVLMDQFMESTVMVHENWKPNASLFSKRQFLEMKSRFNDVAQAVETARAEVAMRDFTCDALNQNEFAVYTDMENGEKAYRLTLNYMLKNSGNTVYQLMLYEGIYTYSTDVMLIYEDGGYKIGYWRTRYTSEGALDIDFDADTVDQG